jgi:GR25 family glycosyltransferase involved in LPS biosynthesis
MTIRQLNIRQLDSFRQQQGGTIQDSTSRQLEKVLAEMASSFTICAPRIREVSERTYWAFSDCLVHSFANLSSGPHAYDLIKTLVAEEISDSENATTIQALRSLLEIGQAPTVRVINLERRADRLRTFMAQAQSERLLVFKAVVKLVKGDCAFWGEFAYDGQGRALEVEQRLSKECGRQLTTMVDLKWRPGDLKAFDRDAREDEKLVPMSPSERACALSHIASWEGVRRSLSVDMDLACSNLLPYPNHLLRLFRISGFASGKALLSKNKNMPPTPVCIVLEDDAILVDRFVDRLQDLLEELPRDFHFCSIGYSRPKTAPVVKYSSQVGIPTCTWYLTGYILSLAGAHYLLDNLPVQGPVDSWIGLKMCANWDNIYGQTIGVGVHSRPTAESPARKDLAQILKFRAFCALIPLCHQKILAVSAQDSESGVAARSWRQRDTDITYSGHL